MSTHDHILLRTPARTPTEEETCRRYAAYYGYHLLCPLVANGTGHSSMRRGQSPGLQRGTGRQPL